MNRNRIIIGLAVAIVAGLLAGRYVYKQFQQASSAKQISVSDIVVAADRIPLGTRLEAQHLRLLSWPSRDLPQGSFTRIEDCVDRAAVTTIVENEPILEAKLASKEAGAGLAVAIPEGTRALSVRVDDVIGVAGFVGPGTMVDVLVTGDIAGGGNSITRNILEDIRVLAAGQKVEQDKEGKPQTVAVVTLQVTPEQANKLAMASTNGRIHLALRNTVDRKEVNPPPVYRASLFSGGPPPASHSLAKQKRVAPPPAPKAPDIYVVEVIRGDKRENHNFPAQ